MKEKLKIGDKVEVIDAGLLMLQRFAPKKSKPNNVGKIANILLSVRAGLLKRNFKYETKSKIQMEWRGSEG